MRKLIRKFVLWVLNANADERTIAPTISIEDSHNTSQPAFRLGVIAASNGRILEMSTYKRNPHGPDWTVELFIVPEDQTLAQCITTILTVKGLT